MQVTFDTANLSDLDKQVLAVLSGGATAPAPAAPATPAPKASKAAPAKAEPTPTPAPAAEENGAVTMEDAVKLATKLVSGGDAAKVKEALGKVGAKRVSEIPEDKVAAFVASLS